MKEKKDTETSIIGIIVPADWDDNDNLIELAIQTIDEEEYIIKQNKKGRELLDLIEQEVEVIGTTTENGDGNIIIEISEYSLKEYIDEDEHKEKCL
jgi:hypothetical protein